jgi:large subunit ribosomal protein L18
LCVFRSLSNIYAQIIDDETQSTLVSASSLESAVKSKIGNGGNKEAAKEVGKLIAQKALEKGIEKVVFDRGGYIYHGRVLSLAEAAREAGLNF